jgi:hypothetical protein
MILNLNFSRGVRLLICVFLIITFSRVSWGKEIFFPLDRIKPGMTGEGYSVFLGTKIEKFSVKVLATVKGNLEQGDLILVRISGGPLQESGGLAAGMSGSPVYISRKLAGAISYGFENADSSLALVTPITSMLNLMDKGAKVSCRPLGSLKPVPVVTPVTITGMGRRGYELLRQALEPYGLKVTPSANYKGNNLKAGVASLQPGGAVSVQMVLGDYQVSAIGTVTFINDKTFLAFGHPFTNKGNVNYPACRAYILQTVKSPIMSFKIGVPLTPVGRIEQDRQAGILGKIGEKFDLIPVVARVKDLDRNQTCESRFQVINNEQMYHDLIISGVTDTIDRAINRIGSGTAKVTIQIKTGEREAPICRENLFYGKDIAVSCLKDLQDALDILAFNEFCPISIQSIDVNIEIQNKQDTARIQKIDWKRTTVKPGDSVQVDIQVHTFRGESFTVPFEVKLPDNIEPGKLTLTARGGSKGLPGAEEGNRKKENHIEDYNSVKSFADLLENYLTAPKNNEIVLEYYPPAKQKSDDVNIGDAKDQKPVQLKQNTNYHLTGEAQLTVDVVIPEVKS